MSSPRYLYRKNNFIFSLMIGTILFLLWPFSSDLLAESYSSYLFDDFKAQNDWGRVKVSTKTRSASSEIAVEEGFHIDSQIFSAGNFRSQRGGNQKDEAGKYLGSLSGNSQVDFRYRTGSQIFSFLIGPRLYAQESRLFETRRNSVWDAESLVSYSIDLNRIKLAIEGGRGWQRLDGFGFLFNGMSNYGQLQIRYNDFLSISFHSLRFKPEEESLTPNAWNYSRKEMAGLTIRSTDHLFWENIQVFHYRYSEPMYSQNPSQILPSYQFGSFLYSGLEFRSMKFWETTNIDLSLIHTTGIRKNKTAPWTETQATSNSFLAYTSLHGILLNTHLSIGGLYTTKDRENRTDSNSNGYAAPLGEPRVLGGYSSFLLYQSVSFPNDKIFYEFADKRSPGFENKGLRMFGVHVGYYLMPTIRGDIFINRSSSEMGNGTEIITKLTKNFEQNLNGFISGSICYATIDSYKKIVLISEPFSETEKRKDFLRFYISAGFQF